MSALSARLVLPKVFWSAVCGGLLDDFDRDRCGALPEVDVLHNYAKATTVGRRYHRG